MDEKGFLCIRTGERNEHPDSDLVAEVYCGGGNAHLIAAAPELFEALADYVDFLEPQLMAAVDAGYPNEQHVERLGRAKAALRKARGETA